MVNQVGRFDILGRESPIILIKSQFILETTNSVEVQVRLFFEGSLAILRCTITYPFVGS